ncbi:hypothetical protein JXR93_12415 [bacterium]|nr:hypothetical protein [bacterium]
MLFLRKSQFIISFFVALFLLSCSSTKKKEDIDKKEIFKGIKTVSGELQFYNRTDFIIDGIFLEKDFFMKDGKFNREYEYLFNKMVNVHGELWEIKCEKNEFCFMGGFKYKLKKIDSIELKNSVENPLFFQGTWVVNTIVGSSPLATIKKEDAEEFLGKKIQFQKERFISNGKIFSEVEYALKAITKAEETEFLLEKIKFLTPKIISVKVLKNKKEVDVFGSIIFPRGGDELIAEWKGFYFSLKKK